MSLQNSYVEALVSIVMVLGSGAFGKYLDHESGALMNGMSVFRKQAPESL